MFAARWKMVLQIGILGITGLLISAAPLRAQQTWTWNKAGGGKWDGNNWDRNGFPNGNKARAILGQSIQNNSTVDLNISVKLHSLLFDSAKDYTVKASGIGQFVLHNAPLITVSGRNGSQTIDAPVQIQGNGDLLVRVQNNVADGLTISGVISGDKGLTKWGIGTLELTADNTYKGSTLIQEGTIVARSDKALGNPGTTTIVATKGSLVLNAIAANLNINEKLKFEDGGTVRNEAGTNTLKGDVRLSGTANINVVDQSELTINGKVTNDGKTTGSLIKNGTGTLVLNGTSTYTGGTTIKQGTLIAASDQALGMTGKAIVFGGATLGLQGGQKGIALATPLQINGAGVSNEGAILNIDGNNTLKGGIALFANSSIGGAFGSLLTIKGVIAEAEPSNSSALTKTGFGDLILTNANTYRGGTTIEGGSLVVANNTALGNPAEKLGTTVGPFGTLALTGQLAGKALSVVQDVTLDGSSIVNEWGKNTLTGTTTLKSDSFIGVQRQNDTLTLPGAITGAGGLTKHGDGTLQLSGKNTYTGGTVIAEGKVIASSDQALGAPKGSTTVMDGANLGLKGGITIVQNVTINGTGVNKEGAIENIAGKNTLTGTLGVLGKSSIVADGGSMLTLNGTINKKDDLNLTTKGAVDKTNLKISALIQGGGNLVKDGTGIAVLAANNTYIGPTLIRGGTLQVDNTDVKTGSGTGTGSVSASAGGTLAGTGRVAGPVSVDTGGTLHPGDAGDPGLLRIASGLSMAPGSHFDVMLDGSHADPQFNSPPQYGQLLVNGPINVSESLLDATLNYIPGSSDRLFLLVDEGPTSILGTFTGPDIIGSTIVLESSIDHKDYRFEIGYAGNFETGSLGGGQDLVLYNAAAVSEPAAWMLLLIACGTVVLGKTLAAVPSGRGVY
jgi:autotransporter-associated beta strand protein